MFKKLRSYTIGKIYATNRFVPMIRLSGKWLEELGFQCGGYVDVKCENGQIIITPNTEREEAAAAEKAFMERETKKLKERFKKEKEEIVKSYVAEQRILYGSDSQNLNDSGEE